MAQHPLEDALAAAGVTQSELCRLVRQLKRRRRDGRPLRIVQSTISQICNWKRGTTPEVARAIADALRGRADISAADILLAEPADHVSP
jgi:hypothetical protein